MKILATADTVGGVWTYALELAAALRDCAVTFELATMGAALNPEQWQQVHQLPNVRVHESQYRLEWMDDAWPDVSRAGEWLLRLERQLQPDVVHLNGYVHGFLPWQKPVLMVGHSCVLSWWQAVHKEPAPPAWGCYAQEVRAGLQAANLVLAPTAAMLHALQRHYGPLPHSRVIFNGRAPAAFAPEPKQPLVLAAGRIWDEAKNLALLDEVAPQLSWPVMIAGSDEHPDGRRLPPRHAQFLGRLTDDALAMRLRQAAIYALPARYEPFGLSALEAGLAGCALVLGDLPSLREVWGDAATFVDPNDAEAVRTAIQQFIDDEPHRHAMARRARDRACQFTPQRQADAYLNAYRLLTTNPS